MRPLQITDVRALPGDSAFLIDDGKTAILCDAGFGFTGFTIADNVRRALGERPLDYIFLTHSHYDHALGAPCVLSRYPAAKVVAGAYAAQIFAKDSAKAKMRELDRKFAAACGVTSYPDLADELRVDIAVLDGDTVRAGDMVFTAVALPGHTKCSVGFYLAENKLLLGSETLGVFDGDKTIMPCYLVGYRMALDSIAKAKALAIDNILFPHLGLAGKEKTAYFLANAAKCATETAEWIAGILRAGGSREEAIGAFKQKFYRGKVKETYPIDAMMLNTTIMVNLIEKELILPPA